MVLAKELELGQLVVDSNINHTYETSARCAQFANYRSEGEAGRKEATIARSESRVIYCREFNVARREFSSFTEAWARIGLDFPQLCFTAMRYDRCPKCGPNISKKGVRSCMLDLSTALTASMGLTSIEELLALRFGPIKQPGKFCTRCKTVTLHRTRRRPPASSAYPVGYLEQSDNRCPSPNQLPNHREEHHGFPRSIVHF